MIWLRYVLHEHVAAYVEKGWTIVAAPMLGHHGHYSTLMQYEGEHEPG